MLDAIAPGYNAEIQPAACPAADPNNSVPSHTVAATATVPNSAPSARAQITGQTVGMLKLLFHRQTLEILGIHCFGANASEIIRQD